jgi:uncharacterized protein
MDMTNDAVENKGEILKKVITFLALTSAVSAGIFIWMFSGARNSTGAVFLMMWTPGISAMLTSLIYRDRIADYGWKPGKAVFLGYGYLFPLLVSLVAYGSVWLAGLAGFSVHEVINYRWARMLGFSLPAPFLAGLFAKMSLGFLVNIVFVLGEEIGWSGFLTPKLSKLTSAPVTSLIVGCYWAIWHYPAIIGGFYGSHTPLWAALPGFTMVCVASSLARTVLLSRSKSLWTGVILHASGNTILMGIFWEMTVHKGYAGYLVSEMGVFSGIVYLLFALMFWRHKKPGTGL